MKKQDILDSLSETIQGLDSKMLEIGIYLAKKERQIIMQSDKIIDQTRELDYCKKLFKKHNIDYDFEHRKWKRTYKEQRNNV